MKISSQTVDRAILFEKGYILKDVIGIQGIAHASIKIWEVYRPNAFTYIPRRSP